MRFNISEVFKSAHIKNCPTHSSSAIDLIILKNKGKNLKEDVLLSWHIKIELVMVTRMMVDIAYEDWGWLFVMVIGVGIGEESWDENCDGNWGWGIGLTIRVDIWKGIWRLRLWLGNGMGSEQRWELGWGLCWRLRLIIEMRSSN